MKKNRNEIQKDIVNSLPIPFHGLLEISMRVGKTKIAIDTIKKEKCKSILWVTNSPKLRDEDIPNEFIKWKAKGYLKKTKIITYHKLSEETGKYDKIILDEIQFITPNNSINLLNSKLKYNSILGMTGKLPTHKEKWEIYNQLKLRIHERISIDDAVDLGLIADYKVFVVSTQLNNKDKNIEAGKKGEKFKTTELANYNYLTNIVNRAMYSNNKNWAKFAILNRLRFIYTLPSKLEAAKILLKSLKGRTLLFMGSIDHAEQISKYTYHSKTDKTDLNKFLNNEINILGCVNAGGTGFTFLNTDNIIIAQANSNKRGDVNQKLTRSLTEQKGFKGNIYILCCENTVDENWVSSALESFDKSKISYITIKNYIK